MKLTAILGALCLLGVTHAQSIPLQCAVQGDNGYQVPKTSEFTSSSCSSAGGSLGSTPGGGRAGGMSCCTTPTSGKDAFYSACRSNGETAIPQPC
ncbi:hypothetical protein diail_3841 [Diaporthe ilicicola]|nr:hypothetical protein diail_3841 [Diaporthe ilicicola]